MDKAVKIRVGKLFKKHHINIKDAFDLFDKDKSRSISLSEFINMLQQLKLGMSKEQIKSAFDSCVTFKNELRFEEFSREFYSHEDLNKT